MNRILGVTLLCISGATFGTLLIFGRFAYASGLDVATMMFIRFTIAGIIMLAWMLIRRESLPKGKTLLLLVGMGGLGYFGQAYCYMSSIQYASAGLAVLLLYLYPLFVTILSVIFLKSRLTLVKVLALALAITGTALTANPQGGQLPGVLLAISSALIYAIYIVVGSGVMQKVSAVQSSTVVFLSAGVSFGILTAFQGPHLPDNATGWQAIAGIVVVATLIPVSTFLAGLKIVGPTDASLLSTLEPVVTLILAVLVLHETIQPLMLLGGGLILAAVILSMKQPQQPGMD